MLFKHGKKLCLVGRLDKVLNILFNNLNVAVANSESMTMHFAVSCGNKVDEVFIDGK